MNDIYDSQSSTDTDATFNHHSIHGITDMNKMTNKRIQYSLDGKTWHDCDRIEVRILPLTESQKYDEPDRYPTSHDIDQWNALVFVFVAEAINIHLECDVTSELNILGVYSEWESYCDVYDAMIS